MTALRFGVSRLPGRPEDDALFLDQLVEEGHRALELPFVKGFPWKEKRCRVFAELAAAREVRLSLHAPYFAVLTVQDETKGAQCLAALEHSMKLGGWLGATVAVAHLGHSHGEEPGVLMERVRARLDRIGPKVEGLGVGLGLETAGNEHSFGSLGDIAQLADEFGFVRPVVDWAHIHAMTGSGLTSRQAFATVLDFIGGSFPGWMIHPLHCQFTDNQVGSGGEVRHLPYGEGSLRVGPLVEAAHHAGVSLTLISEAREEGSHRAIWAEVRATLARLEPGGARRLTEGDYPAPVTVVPDGSSFRPVGVERPLRLGNIDKVFFPGTTKGELIQYYASIAPILLPHLKGRPLSMNRFPDGIGGASFYEKRAPGHQPDWMRTAPVESDSQGGIIDFLLADSTEALMWFANMGCIEVHPFHSTVADLDKPTYAIFDLDPSEGASWEQVVSTSRLLRVALDRLGLRGHPKLSGGRGLHVYVPLDPIHDHARVRRFVGEVGSYLAAASPEDVTMEWDKPKRKGRVFIDHNRNAFGQTVASVYSVRPRPDAPVSVPILWEEVETVQNGMFTMRSLWDRLQRHGDLFAPVLAGGQTLDRAEAVLGGKA